MAGGHDDVPAYVAHTPNGDGVWHELIDHLTSVGALAEGFADRFGAGEWGRLAGLWHDLGKANPAFRDYLVAAHEGRTVPSPGHSSAGAALAAEAGLHPLAFVIAGHHAGLPSDGRLEDRLAIAAADTGAQRALALLGDHPALKAPPDVRATVPKMLDGLGRRESQYGLELLIRMVFSALIDADRLDTEAHTSPEQARTRRHDAPTAGELLGRLRARHAEVTGERAGDPVSDARDEIRRRVVEQAVSEPPGLFTLTSPTGSGKTLTVLEAALAHAERHGLDRVVLAVPFISVTEQVAETCRAAVDVGGDALLEHHSNVRMDDDAQFAGGLQHRLALENWDMPVVVTTTVRLLESLFSDRPSECRRLHRLAGSVVVIDESQSIPWRLVDPAMRMLRQLTEQYGASVILSTATQPRFGDLPSMSEAGVQPTELLGDLDRWAGRFARVEVRPRIEPMGWEDLVDEVLARAEAERQVLVVVNTIADAEMVVGLAAGGPGVRLLTTRLCPAHRQVVLSQVRHDLVAGRPVLLVSTQLIEAGVDVDFPAAFRAVGPVPSVAQVAGRVNRHGRRVSGELVVFDPVDGGMPPGDYKTGAQICREFMRSGRDLLAPGTLDDYFRLLKQVQGSELHGRQIDVDERRRHLDYPTVAEGFRLIADDTVSVLVHYGDFDPSRIDAPASPWEARRLLRRLQPYMVSLRRPVYERAVEAREAVEIPGLPVWRWDGTYDEGLAGLVAGGRSEIW
jgi:CRISPR-associated endonuclease/helicase Cas3